MLQRASSIGTPAQVGAATAEVQKEVALTTEKLTGKPQAGANADLPPPGQSREVLLLPHDKIGALIGPRRVA